jgi:tight adherence protein C
LGLDAADREFQVLKMHPVLPWLVCTAGAAGIVALLWPRRNGTAERLAKAGRGDGSGSSMGGRSAVVPPSPVRERRRPRSGPGTGDKKATFRERLVHAGFYSDGIIGLLRLLRIALLAAAVLGGYLISLAGLTTTSKGLFLGLVVGIAGTIAPAFLLDHLKRRRQDAMRQALPDALDVLVICLQAGLSLPASLSRVAAELATTHSTLARELMIVEREIQLGQDIGSAMRSFAKRFDLEELRHIAAIINQGDRYGAQLSQSLTVVSDGMRVKRQQRAEEVAHKAAVKLVFPTALLIFPAMFIVTLGPAILDAIDILVPILTNSDLRP